MEFKELLTRILFRWWLIAIFTIGFTLAFYNWTTSETFQASIGLGISLNSEDYLKGNSDQIMGNKTGNLGPEYVYSLEEFSKYLFSRFSSVEVQTLIAEKAGIRVNALSSKQPFYEVSVGSGGYFSLTYELGTRESAEKFIEATKTVFREVILTERYEGELAPFRIRPKEKFIQSISPVSRPPQFVVLPSVAGFLIGLTVASIIPIRKKSNA